MEIHHPHHPTHKKKWSEYLLEFFMLFTAVTLGFFAENLREHFVEKNKAILNVQNLYKDLKDDSLNYVIQINNRKKQDSCFEIISKLYIEKKIEAEIPTLYAAHSYIVYRIMPIMNTTALDQMKSSGALNFIEDEILRNEIQSYANDAANLKTREQREYGYIDRMIDPITTKIFEYNFYQKVNSNENIEIENNKILLKIEVPKNLKINNQSTFDWDNYFSIIAMLKTIRNSTDRSYTLPVQNKCSKLLGLVRNYLIENKALIEK